VKGFSARAYLLYDYRIRVLQHTTTQLSYNTDCCGYSVQYRRFSIGNRNENQFRVAFAIANIGSFGTLRRQERMF
jgi:LPS-assembly protein